MQNGNVVMEWDEPFAQVIASEDHRHDKLVKALAGYYAIKKVS